jgi:c-type cytochrome biogenesis protein CcmF
MGFELILVALASALIFIDITLPLISKPLFKRLSKYTVALSSLAFVLILWSYIQLLFAFISNDFSFSSVYSFSSSSLPLLSKVYASWAGAGGSMLLLSLILSLLYFGSKLATYKKPERFQIVSSQILGFVVLIFLIVTLLRNPFERLPTAMVEGLGLNPQLQSFWMAIHPPIVFSAYAFVVLAFALTLASLRTNQELEKNILFKISTYASWILLTIGIALGGVWAYAVLGWGGYWAWDPVETASLLPWLILTAYFLTRTLSKHKTSLTRESMIMLTFASLVFLSALTRGGLTQSVHSYATSAIGPIMLSFAVAMMGLFFFFARGKKKPFLKLEFEGSSLISRSSYVSFWALIIISIVCLAGLAFKDFPYSYFTYPFVLLFIISLVGFSLDDKTHYVRQFLIVVISLVAGGVLSAAGLFSENILLTLTAPLFLVVLALLLYRLAKSARRKTLLWQRLFGLAVVVMLLGVFVSGGAKTSTTITDVKSNVSTDTLGATIQVANIKIINATSKVYNTQAQNVLPQYSAVTADVTIHYLDAIYSGEVSASFYPNYGLAMTPLIVNTPSGDLYVHLEINEDLYNILLAQLTGNSTTPATVTLTVQRIPMVYLVWVGVILMVLSMILECAVDLRKTIRQQRLIIQS